MREFYVYEIIDPRDNKPFYIGKGRGYRMRCHLYSHILRKKSPKNNRIKDILSEELKPIFMKVKKNLSETDAFNLEREIIDRIIAYHNKIK